MRRSYCFIAAVVALAVLGMLSGCGGGDAKSSAVGTAGKPGGGGGLPLVGDATGTIYYGNMTTGHIVSMDTNGGNVTTLDNLDHRATEGFEVSRVTSPRFFLFDAVVGSVYHIFAARPGGAAVDLIGDPGFQADSAVITADDSTIYFTGFNYSGGVYTNVGVYRATLTYDANLLPMGVTGITQITPTPPHGALNANATMDAGAWDPTGNGSFRDLFVGLLAGGTGTNITNTSGVDELPPDWAPSARLAFGRGVMNKSRLVGYDIYTCSETGGSLVKAVSSANTGTAWNCFQQAAPAWGPNSDQLAFIARRSQAGSCAIMRSAADGSTQAKNLTGGYVGLIWCVKWRS